MDCSTSTDGLIFSTTEGTLTKTSGAYTFTKSATTLTGVTGLTLGSSRWDYSSLSSPSFSTTYHYPTSATTHMKCFFGISQYAPFSPTSFTDLVNQGWVENSYIAPTTSETRNGTNTSSAYSAFSLTAILLGFFTFQA